MSSCRSTRSHYRRVVFLIIHPPLHPRNTPPYISPRHHFIILQFSSTPYHCIIAITSLPCQILHKKGFLMNFGMIMMKMWRKIKLVVTQDMKFTTFSTEHKHLIIRNTDPLFIFHKAFAVSARKNH